MKKLYLGIFAGVAIVLLVLGYAFYQAKQRYGFQNLEVETERTFTNVTSTNIDTVTLNASGEITGQSINASGEITGQSIISASDVQTPELNIGSDQWTEGNFVGTSLNVQGSFSVNNESVCLNDGTNCLTDFTNITWTNATGTNLSFTTASGTTVNATTLSTHTIGVSTGTAGVPSVSFLVDPDTGTYQSAVGAFGISINGTNRFNLDGTNLVLGAGLIPSTQGTRSIGEDKRSWGNVYASGTIYGSGANFGEGLTSGTSTIRIGRVNGKGCLVIADNDSGGFTYCQTLNGTMTCNTTSCE